MFLSISSHNNQNYRQPNDKYNNCKLFLLQMHINTSDVFLCKKSPIMNISARATINPKQDNEEHNNLQYALPKYIREKNNILNNKNIQSLSAAALPSLENVQLINNCQLSTPSSKKMQDNNYFKTNLSTEAEGNPFVSKQKEPQQAKKQTKVKRQSLNNQFNSPSHHKSSTQITFKNFRQTIQPHVTSKKIINTNSINVIPKHKQPDWIHKMEIYKKLIKSPKAINGNFVEQTKDQQVKGANISHRVLFTNQNKQQVNTKNISKNKLQFRQTLDPQMQSNFWQTKNNLTSFGQEKKRHISKQRSLTKIQKTNKNQQKILNNKTHHVSQPNIFWKNKAISPPSKSFSPQINHNSTNQFIPPLPLKNKQRIIMHKPSFFMNKKSLNRFYIVKQLGTGTYSDAFLCMQKKINALFCIKRYHKATIRNFPQILQIFIRKTAFQLLAEHPNIVQLYDVFCDGQFVYTLQQYMQGGKLHNQIQKQVAQVQKQRRLSAKLDLNPKDGQQLLINQSKIIDKIFDINSALCYVHQSCDTIVKTNKKQLHPLVHGDIKTRSILVSLGVCKIPSIQPINTQFNNINSYSPPQQIIEQVFIPKSDIWNLGLVLFELCAQRKLFGHCQNQKQQNQQGNKLGYQVFNVNITQEIQKLQNTTHLLKQLMKKLLMIQPELRPSSDIVMSSNVFRMYGFDIEWKQRRHQKLMKQKQQFQTHRGNLKIKNNKHTDEQNLNNSQNISSSNTQNISKPSRKSQTSINFNFVMKKVQIQKQINKGLNYSFQQIQSLQANNHKPISKNKICLSLFKKQ